MRVTPNIKHTSVRKFAHAAFADDSEIHSDGYCSYNPSAGELHSWIQALRSLFRSLSLAAHRDQQRQSVYFGHLHGLPKKYLQSYLDEYSFRFSHRDFGAALMKRLTIAVSLSLSADKRDNHIFLFHFTQPFEALKCKLFFESPEKLSLHRLVSFLFPKKYEQCPLHIYRST